MQAVCVYCGANVGHNAQFVAAARKLGDYLARAKLKLVYGGGNIGLMGVLADAALAAGGEVIGVMPEFLLARELAHAGVQQMHRVASMHERKAKMLELSDTVIALPGGLGTLDELFEAMTWHQLGQIQHRIGLLDTEQFYQPLLGLLKHLQTQGFVRAEHWAKLSVSDNVEDLFRQLAGA